MSFSVRLFLGFLALAAVAVFISLQNIDKEIVPGMRQSLEEVLVDTANLLAVSVSEELASGRISRGPFSREMDEFGERRFNAEIWSLQKTDPSLVVYITDSRGIVVYDSRGRDVGADYSRWNDVYLTLRGRYGARSTREDPEDDTSSIMYVAAPIRREGRIIGVLTVGKPSVAVMPFVQAVREALFRKSLWLLLLSLVLGGVLSYGLTISVRKLTHYAKAVRSGKRVEPPAIGEKELRQLAVAMEEMREELEGKAYIERYLQSLTHELKSPLAAIQGASELLDEEMPEETRKRFLGNIRNESERLRQVVDRLLGLSALEMKQAPDHLEAVDVNDLVQGLGEDREALLARKDIDLRMELEAGGPVEGERFLLQQAFSNILDNAVNFSPDSGTVSIQGEYREDQWVLTVRDQGPGIPEFAGERVFDRFFSLPRTEDGMKGTGLGLTFVREVMSLHQGSVSLENRPEGGAVATLRLPLRQHFS